MLRNHRIVWPDGQPPGGEERPAPDENLAPAAEDLANVGDEGQGAEHPADMADTAPEPVQRSDSDDFMEKDEDDLFEWDQLEFRSPMSADDFKKELAQARKDALARRKRGPQESRLNKARAR